MNDLVKFKNNVPVVSTFDLFEKIGYREHRTLKRVIDKNIDAFNGYGFMHLEVQKPTGKKGGRPTESYLLNEDHFILLVILAKNTKESTDLKIRISDEFRRMRNTLAKIVSQRSEHDWQEVRSDGKLVYRQKTDVIKTFVEYAVSQGSKNADRYYSNLAKMENSALFYFEQKYKNMREILTIKQLMQISTADDVIEKALQDGMNKGLPYKDCFQLAKCRIIAFAEIIGKSPVLALTDKGNKGE